MTKDPKEAISDALSRACEFEGQLLAAGQSVRERSKVAYGSDLLDARMCLMAALSMSLDAKNGVPGKTNEGTSHRLVLLTTFIQGIPAAETLISEGQYAKAAAVLKQDYEILARLKEVEDGVAQAGRTPNARYAPEGSQRIYGELNRVAHPSNQDVLNELLDHFHSGEIKGISPQPVFQENAARGLYEVHVFTLLHAVREHLKLQVEMYPDDVAAFESAIRFFMMATGFVEKAGFIVEPSNK